MAHITEETIERIKREVSLVGRAEAAGVALGRHGSNGDVATRCLFHSPDETASLVITPSKNIYHCFGCGAAGNVIQWEMAVRGVGFREAVAELLAVLGTAPGTSSSAPSSVSCPVDGEMTDRELMEAVTVYYHATLTGSSEALGYLERRGLQSPELVGRFRLGYADRSLGTLLPEKNRVESTGTAFLRSNYCDLRGLRRVKKRSPSPAITGRARRRWKKRIISEARTPRAFTLPQADSRERPSSDWWWGGDRGGLATLLLGGAEKSLGLVLEDQAVDDGLEDELLVFVEA